MAKKHNKKEKSRCRFSRENIDTIDYKEIQVLQKLCTSQGKLFSRKRSGNCASIQRQVKIALKRARYMGLMPYVG